MKVEIRRLAGKRSYQGKSLNRRISQQAKNLRKAHICERKAHYEWLQAQLGVMREEDRLTELSLVGVFQSKVRPRKESSK